MAGGSERGFHRQPRVDHENLEKFRLGQKPFQDSNYFRAGEVVREAQNDNTDIAVRRVLSDVGKVQIACEKCISGLTDTLRNPSVRSGAQTNIPGKLDLMSVCFKRPNCRPRHIGIDHETHAGLNGGQRVKGFLLRQVGYEIKRSPDVVGGEIVLPLNLPQVIAATVANNATSTPPLPIETDCDALRRIATAASPPHLHCEHDQSRRSVGSKDSGTDPPLLRSNRSSEHCALRAPFVGAFG